MFHHHFLNEIWVVLVLAVIAAFVGHAFVEWIVKPKREKIRDAIKERCKEKGIEHDDIYKYTDDITKPIGWVERALYVFALFFGHPEFVAIWLTLKTVIHWRAWSEGNQYGDAISRGIFNLFVLGNGASLLAVVLTLVFGALFLPIPYGFH